MRNGGEGRARLLLVILIVTSLFLITLDLRGVKVIEGFKQGTQTVLSPFQRAGAVVLNPVKDFFSDVTHLGRTRSQIEKLEAENANLKIKLLNRKNADGQLKQLEDILDLAGMAGYKVVNAKVISHGSSQSFSQTITIDSGSNAGIKKEHDRAVTVWSCRCCERCLSKFGIDSTSKRSCIQGWCSHRWITADRHPFWPRKPLSEPAIA